MSMRKIDRLPPLLRTGSERVRRYVAPHLTPGNVRLGVFAALVLGALSVLLPYLLPATYSLGSANSLVAPTAPVHADMLKENDETNSFVFNEGYIPNPADIIASPKPQISAIAHKDAKKGVTVTDPINKLEFTITPKFALHSGKKDKNRVIYPFRTGGGWLVYTMQSTGVKEDIVLEKAPGDTASWSYDLKLDDGYDARLESNGSIGIYGNPMLLGDVTTATDADKELLAKARETNVKETLLFTIPAPFVVETGKKLSDVKTWFELDKSRLTVKAEGLSEASYPISIDPSIYVETAEKFMRGNDESNIDFDVANTLIQKGKTTGARFDSYTSTMNLPSARWQHATAVAGGYVYTVGGSNGSTNQSSVYWAKFDTSNNTITSPNPGDGSCSDWCTDSFYNLPAPRVAHSIATYNGYLYVIGGEDSSCTTGNGTGNSGVCDTVYVAKLGANGEPQLWHPTDTNKDNWVYWYRDSDISSPRSYAGVAAYNNHLYLLGGKTDSAGGGVTTVEYADLRPTGTLSAWTSTGMTALPSVRFGHDIHSYNDHLYLVGGNSNGTLQSSVSYIKLNDDGTMVSSWSDTNNFSIARASWGGQFSAISGGYLYVAGGCSAVDAEGECTSTGITNGGTHQTDGSGTAIELASLNADGSVGFWGTISNITNARIGYTLTSWRNIIYSVGGCTAQNTTTGACTTTTNTSLYGVVNQDGDGSTVATSVASGTAPCSGADPYSCDLPGTTTIGNMLSSTAIMNGYLYIIGGCTSNDCSTVSGNTIYSAIDSDGHLRRPASCSGGTVTDSFCVDTADPISGGVAAAAVATFGGRLYVVGGQDGSGLKGNIYHVEVNNDGSLAGAWSSQTFTNVAATSVSYSYTYARANPSEASTYPGNLYIFGGCTASTGGVSCTANSNTGAVYKCNIKPDGSLEEADADDCDTANQLQIGTVPGASASGLALHSGTVYAGYIYLVGGVAPGVSGLDTLRYAKFDNSNNVVAATGTTWAEPVDSSSTAVEMSTERYRSAAFGYNGYLYTVGGYDSSGSGTLSDIQFAKINTSDGSLEQFTTSAVTIDQRWGLSVPVSNSYAYVVGGCTAGDSPTCTTRTSTIQTFQVYNNDSGAPAEYTSAANLFPTDRFGNSATIMDGYAYVAGGCIGVLNCDNATNVVEYAPINDDGSFGTWASTTSLPADRTNGHLESVGGTLYYMGGQNDSEVAQSTIYYATPAANGTISSWSTASGGIGDTSITAAVARSQFSAAVWNDRIYLTGGYDDSDNVTNTVFISPQLSSGGNIAADSWTTGTSFNVARDGLTTIAYANNLYILGGHDDINYLSDVQYTQINSDGTLDSWSYTTSLPRNVSSGDGFAANGYMYIFGGRQSDINCTNNTYVAPISANTTIASGNNPTGLGSWFLTNERFSAERAYTSAVYHEGKAYLLGGSCGDLEAVPGTDVMEDDFDATIDGAEWSSYTDMAVGTECGTVDSGNSLYSTGNSTAQAITKDVDVTYGGTITFFLKIPTSDVGNCNAPGPGEDLVLQYSTNSGSGWSTIATYDESNFNTPTEITETIPSTAQTPNTRFRWYIPEADNNRDEWAIDTVVVNAYVTPPLEEIFEDDFDATIDGADWASYTDMGIGTLCGTIGSGNSLYSTGGNTAQAITTDINLQYGGLISFELRIPATSAGGCNQPQAGEDLELQYSINGGSTWTTFATYDEANYDTPSTITTGIPTAAKTSNVRFRWYMPNADTGSDNWAIDDVSVKALQPILVYTGIHRAVYSSLLSQPQKSKYSITFDTDTNVFPTTWLLNGVDNSIGARWGMQYSSAPDAYAVSFHETFDDGASGDGLTEHSSTIDYDNCYASGGQTNTFSNAEYVTPGLSGRMAIAGSSGLGACTTYFDETTAHYDRYYVRFDTFSNLGANMVLSEYGNTSEGAPIAQLQVTPSGTLRIRDYFTAEVTTSALTANTWYRIETAVYNDTMYLRLFTGSNLHGDIPDLSYSTTLDRAAFDTFDYVNLGITTSTSPGWGMYIDDHKSSPVAWVGSAFPPWGQETDNGDVTLGTLGSYTPLNTAGTDTDYARWYTLSVSVDSSQAYGYPEDVSRGPTINDLSLQFTADPSKRLMHGRTFVGGLQQPLDTP